ncbi:hypothetical protein D4R89_11070 [bacterium]|nr:MAG: hypothetical protein D4R89_11070 [bacterium]
MRRISRPDSDDPGHRPSPARFRPGGSGPAVLRDKWISAVEFYFRSTRSVKRFDFKKFPHFFDSRWISAYLIALIEVR